MVQPVPADSLASSNAAIHQQGAHRRHFVQRRTVIYEDDGVEVARYSLTAATQLATELQTSASFFEEHREFDVFAILPDLTFRIVAGDS